MRFHELPEMKYSWVGVRPGGGGGGAEGVSLLLAHFVFKSYDEHIGLLKCTQIWALPTERLHTALYLQQKERWHSVSTQNA